MNNRILFVDDDRALLNMLERNFALNFDVTLAQSGPEALQIIQDSELFAVTLVDMRMPGMEGTEVIMRAREIAPDSIYIMLTGNQDLRTAVDAVNVAGVFRFLNKPCEIAVIEEALHAGVRKFEALSGQRHLLDQTFAGAINVLNEMVERIEDPPADAAQIKTIVEKLAAKLNFELRGPMPWVPRFLVCGLPTLSRSERQVLLEHPISSAAHIKAVRQLVESSLGLVRRIPRLEPVGRILEATVNCDGSLPRREESDEYFATLLIVSFYIDLLRHAGQRDLAIPGELKRRCPTLDHSLNLALHSLLGTLEEKELSSEDVPAGCVLLTPEQLQEGMIVAADVVGGDGLMLVTKGRPLSLPMIDRLRRMGEDAEVKIGILQNGETMAQSV